MNLRRLRMSGARAGSPPNCGACKGDNVEAIGTGTAGAAGEGIMMGILGRPSVLGVSGVLAGRIA